MATVKALIRKKSINSNGECIVYIRYGHEQKSADFSSHIKISPANWNEVKRQVNSVSPIKRNYSQTELEKPEVKKLIKEATKSDILTNTIIEGLREKILNISRQLRLIELNPTPELVKNKFYEEKVPKDTSLGKARIATLFNDYVAKSNNSDGTKEKYQNAIYHLEEYERMRKKTITVEDVDLNFYDDFLGFLYNDIEKPDGTIGLMTNTVGTTIKNLKLFLKHIKRRGYPVTNRLEDFKVPRENVPIIFLLESEIKKLREHKFESERLSRVRDLFVFNCYAGLRYSDLARLKKSHIKDDVIIMTAYKNTTGIYLPILPVSQEILKKYNYKLPLVSEQKYNDYIKEVCEEAGIDQTVEIIRKKAGNKVITAKPKYKYITSHTAIKTFISLCAKRDIQAKEVAEITGKSIQVILNHYYGIDQDSLKMRVQQKFRD